MQDIQKSYYFMIHPLSWHANPIELPNFLRLRRTTPLLHRALENGSVYVWRMTGVHWFTHRVGRALARHWSVFIECRNRRPRVQHRVQFLVWVVVDTPNSAGI